MSSVENIPISHEEYRSGKYKLTSSSGGEHTARIIYNDDGSINDSTYSDSYKREHGLGQYAKKEDEGKKSKKKEKVKETAKEVAGGVTQGIKETICDFFCYGSFFRDNGILGFVLYLVCFPVILIWIIIRTLFHLVF